MMLICYSASELSKEVQKHESYMKEEYILLLVREKRFDEAISKYIDDNKFEEAQEFCARNAHKNDLLTKLLEKYFEKF